MDMNHSNICFQHTRGLLGHGQDAQTLLNSCFYLNHSLLVEVKGTELEQVRLGKGRSWFSTSPSG